VPAAAAAAASAGSAGTAGNWRRMQDARSSTAADWRC